jgi:broad specificity phosphatase PhoE
MTRVWLLRHGETQGYRGDAGLTARGEAQAARAAGALPSGGLALRHSPSARAAATAATLAVALRKRGTTVDGPHVEPGFANFAVRADGEVHAEPTAAYGAHAEAIAAEPAEGPLWLVEAGRFWGRHQRGEDPIGFWLSRPLLSFEPPARVVGRWWGAVLALDPAGGDVAVCGHSGPMRALATAALGVDLGEPNHLEAVELDLGEGRAEVRYRGVRAVLDVAELEEQPAWS